MSPAGAPAGSVSSRVAEAAVPNSASSCGVASMNQPLPAASLSSVIWPDEKEPRCRPGMSATVKLRLFRAASWSASRPAASQRAVAAATMKSSSAWLSTPSLTTTLPPGGSAVPVCSPESGSPSVCETGGAMGSE
jgi:hypothetical protein